MSNQTDFHISKLIPTLPIGQLGRVTTCGRPAVPRGKQEYIVRVMNALSPRYFAADFLLTSIQGAGEFSTFDSLPGLSSGRHWLVRLAGLPRSVLLAVGVALFPLAGSCLACGPL